MAVKKTTEPAAPKAKKAAPKKAAPKKKAAPAAKAKAAPKTAAPKAVAPKKAAAPKVKKAAPKKAAVPKLTDKQRDFLKKIQGEGTLGFLAASAVDKRSIESLVTKKLVKKGPKDKEKKAFRYTLSKTGEKVLATPAPSA